MNTPDLSFGSAPEFSLNTGDGGVMGRRDFLRGVGVGMAWLAATPSMRVVAGPFSEGGGGDHFIPADKKLAPEWLRVLRERGGATWYTGSDLRTIGMPVGGVCAGQVYLSGEGRLIYWDILNRNQNTGYGALNYKEGRLPTETVEGSGRFEPALEVDQGFAVRLESEGGARVRTLDGAGFGSVRFCGEYPIGRVEYRDGGCGVEVDLEAFSPFIPLDSEASTLPATVMRYTVRSVSGRKIRGQLAGWLENRVCADNAAALVGRADWENRSFRGRDMRGVMGVVRVLPEGGQREVRAPQVLADFEGEGYGGWTVEGEAFGVGPARGTLANQQQVNGYAGEKLVNTYLGGDDRLQGRLISPEFTVDRPWIGFLVGGGSFKESTCINLVVGGQVVRTACGRNEERLRAQNWNVEDLAGRKARLEIVDREGGPWGHINVDQIELRDEPMGGGVADVAALPDFGSMALVLVGEGEGMVSRALPEGAAGEVLFDGRGGLSEAGSAVSSVGRGLRSAVGVGFELEPGECRTVSFVVSWSFPNMMREGRRVGNAYAKRFGSAQDVAGHVALNLDRYVRETWLWHDSYYDSTLPWWLLDRLHSTVGNLASATCQWWESGRFWAWEGCGCCHGTCGHVWNYEHAMARLFPDLERSVREMQDFAPGIGFNAETGSIGFRGEGWSLWAGDSQGGYILKAYREHCCSVDDSFLRRNWANIRKAVEFLIGEDGDGDGMIEGRQHQTYDQDYYGANTFVGALYLGALRAAAVMARHMGEGDFAARCLQLAELGSRESVKRLWNGEYFIQDVDLEQHPEWQYADGCLADQMFGQGWAHQVGLGYLYPPNEVRMTLESIWRYCWTPDVGAQNAAHKPERWFARPGEGGLFTCTWPRSAHLGAKSTRYRNEVWTGIEYQVAGHMAWEGMVTECLAMCRAIHERYHPAKRNPWNEIECGDHYARALASWGVLTGLSGFELDGPAGRMGFAPRMTPEDFRAVFTAAEGWGNYAQRRGGAGQVSVLEVKWGEVFLRELKLALPAEARLAGGRVFLGSEELEVGVEQRGGGAFAYVDFGAGLRVSAGQVLRVVLEC
jgi:uncharacterized protein (DUF608 family)